MILVTLHRNPERLHVAREQQDLLATLAAFGLPMALVFSGDALKQLDKDLLPEDNLLDMLPGFGVTEIYANTSTLPEQGFCLSRSRLPCKTISAAELKALSKRAKHAVTL